MKVKTTKALEYKKGLAVVIEEVEEISGEYRSSWKTTIRLYFKSKNAITNASKILGFKLDKKRTLEDYERGKNGFRVNIDGETEWVLKTIFGYKDHIAQSGYFFSYFNEHSGNRIHKRINPSDIYKGITERELDMNLGSTANGNGTFKMYLDMIIEKINKGQINYCSNIY
ncbi:MAG: hypothetical protein M0Q88_02855 [Bacilli bacterium]|nr:hypothetical protein [Bacilli bacterium]